jgi:hypothetical protein
MVSPISLYKAISNECHDFGVLFLEIVPETP